MAPSLGEALQFMLCFGCVLFVFLTKQLCLTFLSCMADRSMQRTYQMNEEDFPPLSFRGQPSTSSAGLNGAQESSATSQGPHYEAYVTVSPSS